MLMASPLGLAYAWPVLTGSPAGLSMAAFLERPVRLFKRVMKTFSIWLKKPGSLLLSLMFTWVHMLCMFGSIYLFVDDLGRRFDAEVCQKLRDLIHIHLGIYLGRFKHLDRIRSCSAAQPRRSCSVRTARTRWR